MIVHVCDRCHSRIDASVGSVVTIDDKVRGMNGEWELCARCSERLAWFLQGEPNLISDEVGR